VSVSRAEFRELMIQPRSVGPRGFFDLTVVPPRGLVPHAERMAALQERNAEMEFYGWCFVIGLAVLGFIFKAGR